MIKLCPERGWKGRDDERKDMRRSVLNEEKS